MVLHDAILLVSDLIRFVIGLIDFGGTMPINKYLNVNQSCGTSGFSPICEIISIF